MTDAAEELRLMELLDKDMKENLLLYFKPFPYQAKIFELGMKYRERFFQAGNQVGKTRAGAYELASHLTGLYPDWWKGMQYSYPIETWGCGKSGQAVRDTIQQQLLGKPGLKSAEGTALIPKHRLKDTSRGRSATDAIDQVQVEHSVYEVKKGAYIKTPTIDGVSGLTFKSYDQEPERFVGATLDYCWCDEPPPQRVFGEVIARLSKGNSRLLITATPLQFRWLVQRFEEPHPDRISVTASLDDRPDMTPKLLNTILEGYLPQEREARRLGIGFQGQGAVFPYPEAMLRCAYISPVPPHWRKLWAIDFGIGHPFAAVLLYHDPDADVIYVAQCIKMKDAIPLQHVAAMKAVDPDAPVTWPQDGTLREKSSGIPLAASYRNLGLKMLPTHATDKDGGYSFEGGIMGLVTRMTTNRFKVMSHCTEWFTEYRYYHRDDSGNVVKLDDDVLSATRIGVMNIRAARPGYDLRNPPKRSGGSGNRGLAPGAGQDYFGIDA